MDRSQSFDTDKDYTQNNDTDKHGEGASLLSESASEPMPYVKPKRRIRHLILTFLSLLLNIILLAVVFIIASHHNKALDGYNLAAFSPAYEAEEYVPVTFSAAFGHDTTEYQGWPSDELDERWDDLFQSGISLRISEKEARPMINSTVRIPLPGYENDYLVGIDVFHQLHCLNMVRKSLWPKRYNTSWINPDGTVDWISWVHIDHCIESLRQSLLCHADVSPVTFLWSEKGKIMEPALGTTHLCRNFSRVREWAFSRWVNFPGEERRKHVEPDGHIADYSGYPNPEDHAGTLHRPKDWAYTADDL